MSKKFEVVTMTGRHLGAVTTPKAKRAIEFGIARNHADVNERVILTTFCNMDHFNDIYSKYLKMARDKKVECWGCGIMTKSHKHKISYCDKCNISRREEEIRDKEVFTKLRTKFMLDRALQMLEKQNKTINIEEYKESIKALTEYIEVNAGKFDSAHEMLAAIELIRNRIHIKIQKVIVGKRVDFILEEEKIVLEIDGFLHEHSKEADYASDLDVRRELGNDWEVIRIPTKYIEINVSMIYEAIMQLKTYKQQLRKDNNGFMPDFYSDRETQIWKELA